VSALLADARPPACTGVPRVTARTAQEAADALGCSVGQIAKSVVFKRKLDERGGAGRDLGRQACRRGEGRGAHGAVGRADADFVKASTGFSDRRRVAGRAPDAAGALIDRELFRFEEIWAAAGHPNGVFKLSPADGRALGRRDAVLRARTACDVAANARRLEPWA
jgi:prolyl-tRNA editing enzyme YbaK/EbsC (Cys-tRNA(Pro) deacylase)